MAKSTEITTRNDSDSALTQITGPAKSGGHMLVNGEVPAKKILALLQTGNGAWIGYALTSGVELSREITGGVETSREITGGVETSREITDGVELSREITSGNDGPNDASPTQNLTWERVFQTNDWGYVLKYASRNDLLIKQAYSHPLTLEMSREHPPIPASNWG